MRPLVQNVLAAGLMLTVWTSLARGETSGQTSAQAWPQRTVRFIIPLPPGSGTDLAARLLAERLTARSGQPVVVGTRPCPHGHPCRYPVARRARQSHLPALLRRRDHLQSPAARTVALRSRRRSGADRAGSRQLSGRVGDRPAAGEFALRAG